MRTKARSCNRCTTRSSGTDRWLLYTCAPSCGHVDPVCIVPRSRFDPKKMDLTSPYNQRRFRRLKIKADGTIVGRPKTSVAFSPLKKHPTTADLCRPVGIDGYRRTLLLPPTSVRVAWARHHSHKAHSSNRSNVPDPYPMGGWFVASAWAWLLFGFGCHSSLRPHPWQTHFDTRSQSLLWACLKGTKQSKPLVCARKAVAHFHCVALAETGGSSCKGNSRACMPPYLSRRFPLSLFLHRWPSLKQVRPPTPSC